MLNYLRNESSFEFNRLNNETNRIREVARRPNPTRTVSAEDFVYCPNCLASLRKPTFAVHHKKCPGISVNGRKTPQQAAKKLADDCRPKISENLRHILSVLDTNEVGNHAKLDELIIIYGNLLAVQYKPERNYDMVRQRFRILARLVLEAKTNNHNIYDLKTLIHPNNFDDCLKAVDQVAGLSEDGESFKSPATAAAIGTLLNDVSNLLICEHSKVGDKLQKENVKDFQRLLKRRWNAHVSKKVRETQQQNRRKKKVELPALEDVTCLMTFLKNKQINALNDLKEKFSIVADHLGHDIRIHKEFYQIQDIAQEIVQMLGVLETACGNSGEYNNNDISNQGENSDKEASDNETTNYKQVSKVTASTMDSQAPEASKYNDENEISNKNFLDENTCVPWKRVKTAWQITSRSRKIDLNTPAKKKKKRGPNDLLPVEEFFTKLPSLKHPSGYQLVQLDFDNEYPDAGKLSIEKLDQLIHKLQVLKASNDHGTLHKWEGDINNLKKSIISDRTNDDVKTACKIKLLAFLMPPHGRANRTNKTTVADVYSSMIMHVQTAEAVDEAIAKRSRKLKSLN
ncbi:hypothetical protein HCN44_004885 [Aphidius gifuensis]|uniref:Uncharacterized protein n=1 Tax=Aphidius gifuensis TaxID=684658 RepID=A0A834XUQ1_APHGI|nr:hypothetical protein HCN44_004885 [Aphidius gifuensis]